MEREVSVLSGESCLLTLDYALYHVFFCLLQAGGLFFARNTKHFPASHAFGLFALVADYGVAFMTTGTRVLTYPNLARNWDNGWLSGDEALGPVGEFMFFLWFSYSAFGLLLWANMFQDFACEVEHFGWQKALRGLGFSYYFGLAIVPLQFWTAPILSSYLHYDSRTLLLTRHSSKYLYTLMLLLFPVVLHQFASLSKKRISIIWLSGLCLGLIHHAPLFLFDMRGYGDICSLILTLLTEWPALMLGVAVVEHVGGRVFHVINRKFQIALAVNGTFVFSFAMVILLAVTLGPHLSLIDDKDAMTYLIPLIPGHYMHTIGTTYIRAKTCALPKILTLVRNDRISCWTKRMATNNSSVESSMLDNHGDDMLVMASAAKSGAVLSARLVVEIGTACDLCVASGKRSAPGIPGPVEELPSYEGNLLLAINNMLTWPHYVSNLGYDMSSLLQPYRVPSKLKSARVRCVTLVRDPISRLRSLYTYARSGGEHWFRYQSGIMRELNNPSLTLQQSVELFWEKFGRDYLFQSHDYMMMNIELGCVPITMESFQSNFSDAVTSILQVYGVSEAAIPMVLDRVSDSDLSKKSALHRQRDAHISSNKFSHDFVKEVKDILEYRIPELVELTKRHRMELGYSGGL